MRKLSVFKVRKLIQLNEQRHPREAGETPGRTWLRRFLDDIYIQFSLRLLETAGIVAGLVAIVFTIWSLDIAGRQTQLAEMALKDQRVASAWQILSTSGPSSSGKAYALSILVGETAEKISGLKLGCLVEPEISPEHRWCDERVILHDAMLVAKEGLDQWGLRDAIDESDFSDAELHRAQFANVRISGTTFAGANLAYAKFQNVQLSHSDMKMTVMVGCEFRDADLLHFDFSDARLSCSFEHSELDHVAFDNAQLDVAFTEVIMANVSFANAQLQGSSISIAWPTYGTPDSGYEQWINISGATFCTPAGEDFDQQCAEVRSPLFFESAWFEADNPPKGLDLLGLTGIRPGCAGESFVSQAGHVFEPAHDDPCRTATLVPVDTLVPGSPSV